MVQEKEQNLQSVFFVNSTPNSELLKLLKKTEEENKINEDGRIKFVGKAGVKNFDYLKLTDPIQDQLRTRPKLFTLP